EDIALLQSYLTHLKYEISKDELNQRAFKKTTYYAVFTFQEKYKLPATGEVDAVTAKMLGDVLRKQERKDIKKRNKQRLAEIIEVDQLPEGEIITYPLRHN